MDVRVILLPSLLTRADVDGRVVVAFDVFRATTTITAALEAGVSQVVLHPTLDAARTAHRSESRPCLLAGERACVRPFDFDLGNSPGQFDRSVHAGRVVHMATTNGTRALLAAGGVGSPAAVLAGALVNRSAVAESVLRSNADVTLLCAGTDGQPSVEDLLGCGAVIDALKGAEPGNDSALIARCLWEAGPSGWGVEAARGARAVRTAGLEGDLQFSLRVDSLSVVGEVRGGNVCQPAQ